MKPKTTEKKIKKYDALELATKALRKLWRNSPMRKHFIDLACIDKSSTVRERKYKCSHCGESFLLQQIDVDHVQCLPTNSSLQHKFEHFLYGHEHFKNKFYQPTDDFSKLLFEQYYQVLCMHCHKLKTKEERAKETLRKKEEKAQLKQQTKKRNVL